MKTERFLLICLFGELISLSFYLLNDFFIDDFIFG